MSSTRLRLAAALVAMTSAAVAPAQTPWDDHGALRVSPNGRQLQHADGTPFFYLGDTAWELVTRMEWNSAVPGGRGIEYYLDSRAAKGFNVIQAPVISPLTALNNNVEGQKITTGSGFNPNALNEAYLQRVDRIIDEAEDRGLYVALLPTWGTLVNGGTINAGNAERYGEVIGARYADRPNIIWTLGGDLAPGKEDIWNLIAKGVANGVNGTPGSASPDYSTTLMTFHPAGGRSSTGYPGLGSWMDFNSIQTSHSDPKTGVNNYNPHFDRPAIDYATTPVKPTINTEPPYENITIGLSSNPGAPRHGAYELRLAAYWSVLGGAAGHTYGHNNVWQAHDFDHGYSPQFGANDEWEDSLDTPGAAQMTLMKNLVLSRPFGELVRDNGVLTNYAALSTGKNASSAVASRGDDYALAYSGNGSALSVAMGKIAGANVKAWWYNPRTGDASEIGVFANTGTQTFDPAGAPGNDNDWVLVLSDVLADHPAPGQAMNPSAFRKLHEDFAYLYRFNNASTNGSATITGGATGVTFNSGIPNASQRAVLASHRKDFDFFEQALDIRLSDIAITGDAGAGGNSLFLALGDGNSNEKALYPGADLNNGLAFEIRKTASGVQLAFLEVVNRVNSNESYTLEAMPENVQILLDGDSQTWQVILTGDGFAGGQRIITGDWARLLAADPAFFQLAVGAYNAGTVGSSTIARVGELIVTQVVPEPASLALVGVSALALAQRRRTSR